MTPHLKREVLAIYQSADEAVRSASPKCDSSGRCCRFEEYGHTLFISHFEAEILLENAPPYAIPTSRASCPFQVENLCTAREARPLGCRIYFCDPTYQETGNRITEESLAKLKQLANDRDTGWHYAPLHYFLDQGSPSQLENNAHRVEPLDRRFPLSLVTDSGTV